MKIKVFAILKDYLDEEFIIEESLQTIQELKAKLSQQNPACAVILDSCRFAVNNTFVDINHAISKQETIYIIPPSSGG